MTELAPGVFVSEFVPSGKAFVIALREILGGDAPERGIAVAPADWERVPAATRERILDDITRGDAARGLCALQDLLGSVDSAGER
jgi:hypothetical protein